MDLQGAALAAQIANGTEVADGSKVSIFRTAPQDVPAVDGVAQVLEQMPGSRAAA